MCVLFVDEKIIAEEMSSYRRNQQRTEIIDQDFVPGTVLSCAAILGWSSENAAMNTKTLSNYFKNK